MCKGSQQFRVWLFSSGLVLPYACRHLDGVGNSSDQGEPWLASGQDFTDRMERSRAAGESLLEHVALMSH
jgi:hypothetical protein